LVAHGSRVGLLSEPRIVRRVTSSDMKTRRTCQITHAPEIISLRGGEVVGSHGFWGARRAERYSLRAPKHESAEAKGAVRVLRANSFGSQVQQTSGCGVFQS